MEFIRLIEVEELTADESQDVDFDIHGAYSKLTIHIVPIDSGDPGSPNASSVKLKWRIDGNYYEENPPGAATDLTENMDNIITTDNVHQVGRLTITNGAQPPDGGLKVEIWGLRNQ